MHKKYSNDVYLIETVSDNKVMEHIGSKKTWTNKDLQKELE